MLVGLDTGEAAEATVDAKHHLIPPSITATVQTRQPEDLVHSRQAGTTTMMMMMMMGWGAYPCAEGGSATGEHDQRANQLVRRAETAERGVRDDGVSCGKEHTQCDTTRVSATNAQHCARKPAATAAAVAAAAAARRSD